MARKDLYESRKMYQSPAMLFILLPIIFIILVLGIEFGFKFYHEKKLNDATKTVLNDMMENNYIHTYEQRRDFCINRFKELGYKNTKVMILQEVQDYYVLSMENTYASFITTILFKPKKLAAVSYKGSYNEYTEPIIEKIDTDEEEGKILRDLGIDDDDETNKTR